MPLNAVDHLSESGFSDTNHDEDDEPSDLASDVRLPPMGELTLHGSVRWVKPWFFPQLEWVPHVIELVPPRKPKPGSRSKLPAKDKLVTKKICLKSFGTIRLYGATVQANPNFLSKRGSGDCANQIFWWKKFGDQCRLHKVPKGIYCHPSTAEHLSGLPIGWTCASDGSVKDKLEAIFPWLKVPQEERTHRVASLFSGVLGFELGIRPFVTVVSYVEQSAHCRAVIAARIRDGLADPGVILEDIVKTTAANLGPDIDGYVAGFPCQDVSNAGNQAVLGGSRTVLVKEIFRLYDESVGLGRPVKFLLLENVAAILSPKCREVMQYLHEASSQRNLRMTYVSIDGHMVGAPIWRQRVFILIANPMLPFFQGHSVMDIQDLKAWPQRKWMSGQKVPPIHKWLTNERCDDHKDRLVACGNIVVPAMAYLGMCSLMTMWAR